MDNTYGVESRFGVSNHRVLKVLWEKFKARARGTIIGIWFGWFRNTGSLNYHDLIKLCLPQTGLQTYRAGYVLCSPYLYIRGFVQEAHRNRFKARERGNISGCAILYLISASVLSGLNALKQPQDAALRCSCQKL